MTWLKKKTAALAHLAAQPARPAMTTTDIIRGFCSALREVDSDHRRHDSENERALVGARMANLRKGGAGGATLSDAPMGASGPAITIERAAELSGVII